jgi:hypothetical protein
MVVGGLAISCVMFAGATVSAGDAVQWPVSAGGNGHWYRLQNDGGTWQQARASSNAQGGHLATVTSAAENTFIWNLLSNSNFYPCFAMLGGFQDRSATDYSEPSGGWRWVTGEPFTYTAWFSIEPNNGGPGEDFLAFREFNCSGTWNDIPDDYSSSDTYVIEWSADCNNDGIVDYGQILDGTLVDANADGIPDVCVTLRVPEEYPTIQAAVDAAPNLSAILVGPGIYAPFDLAGKSIAIRSTDGPSVTVIDGSGQGRSAVVFGVGTTLRTTLAGFTVRCGMGTGAYWLAKGGGCYVERGSATFEDCDFTGSVYGCGYGGGIYGAGGSFVVRRCRFLGTYAIHDAGGLQLSADSVALAEQIPNEPEGVRVLVEDCTVTNCYGYNAGGIAVNLADETDLYQEEVVLRGIMFSGNVGEYGPSSLFPSDLRVAGAAGGHGSHLFRVTNCVFGSGSLAFAMCGYWGESYPLNAVVSGCAFPTGTVRRNCGSLSIASSFFCNGTIPVVGGWIDLGNNETSCPSTADCDGDEVTDFHQIVLGRSEDSNGNWVIDACEAIRVPQDYPTIQAAIDAAASNLRQSIVVSAGTYHELFSLDGKDVVVRGAPNNATILDGTGLATSIARFTGGEPATAGLENLVFRNGTAGSRIVPKATFTVGGAVYGRDSSAFIRNCRFEQNEADFGGAVYLLRCDSAVEGCVFAGNEALTDGGAFLAYECAGFVRASDFTANSCGASGSGNGGAFKTVGAKSVDGTFLLQDCTITGTMSGVDGAAVHHFENLALGTAGALRIVDTEISGNTTIVGAGGVRHDGRQSSLVLAGATVVCPNTVRNIDGPFLLESGATVCDCLTDVTGDGSVNGGDLGVVLNAWGLADAQGTGDVNHDGVVDGADLALVLGSWGACP